MTKFVLVLALAFIVVASSSPINVCEDLDDTLAHACAADNPSDCNGLSCCWSNQRQLCMRPRQSWKLFWEDDFNGTSLDQSKWNVVTMPGYPNQHEREYYVPHQVSVSDGNLVLKSVPEVYQGFNYTSGEVTSQGKFSSTYGRWEVRAKLPYSQGLWPAHWLMPDYNICWPTGGEIDVMELLGKDMFMVYGHYHWAEPNQCGAANQKSQGIGYKTNVDTGKTFNIYAVEWNTNTIAFFFNDVLYFTAQGSSTFQIPEKPMYWILNTAVGGDWGGDPDKATIWPQYHYIDYVKVYKPA